MAICGGFRLLNSPSRCLKWKAKTWSLAILLVIFCSQSIWYTTDYVLDQIAYPYNMYQGYPLSIYSNPYRIITNNTCTGDLNVHTIIVIHSKVTNFMKRESIRQTWANKKMLSEYGMRVVFFTGMPFHNDIQALIHQESLDHNDIVQGNFYDSYTNITHKAVLWLRWVKEYCPDAPFILKLDDDVFVNVFSLYHDFLPSNKHVSKTMWCEIKNAGKQSISRMRGKKWRVAPHEFVGLSYYPLSLCRGYFVLLTNDSIGPMFEAAKTTPFFWMDDYYVFADLANKTGVTHISLLPYLSPVEKGVTCFKSQTKLCSLLGVLLESTNSMDELWNDAINNVNINL